MDADEEEDDARLIARSIAEPEMFARLYDRHSAVLYQFAARRLGTALAEDVVGETFLIAFKKRERYDTTRTSARAWLYGIASNEISRHRRSEVRAYRAMSRSGTDPVYESYGDAADSRVAAQANRGRLADALRGLSQGDRHVLLLVAWADLSYEEVATALGIPLGTVRSRLNRARKKMRAALGDTNPILISTSKEHDRA